MTEEQKNIEATKHDEKTQALMDEARAKGVTPASLIQNKPADIQASKPITDR